LVRYSANEPFSNDWLFSLFYVILLLPYLEVLSLRKIIRNAIRCNHCGDVIESTFRYNYAYFRGLVEPVRIMTEDIREKEGIRLVVSDSELLQRMHYWDDKQELLKLYSQCSICGICPKCDFTLRDDAKYFVDQMFIKDKPQIKDKQSL